MPERRLVGAQLLQLVLREVGNLEMLPLDAFAGCGASAPASALTSVDLPAPLRPNRPDARVRQDRKLTRSRITFCASPSP